MADGITITKQSGFSFATIMARRGVAPPQIADALGLEAPDRSNWTQGGGTALIGTGPGVWLAHSKDAPPNWAELLRDKLRGLASVSDQSGAYLLWRLSGPQARRVLQRGAAIDFHPNNFGPGSAATSMIAHISVVIRQLDNSPSYEIACFRSFGPSFQSWLDAAVAAL